MTLVRLAVTLALVITVPEVLGRWHTEPAPSGDGTSPVAVAAGARGERAEIFRDRTGHIYLRFRLGPGGPALAPRSCPTVQIDQQVPSHYFKTGELCRVDGREAVMELGLVVEAHIKSLILYRLMNGNGVAFRYLTEDRQYHETLFRLSNSKQAIKDALGARTAVTAE